MYHRPINCEQQLNYLVAHTFLRPTKSFCEWEGLISVWNVWREK